MIEEVLVVLVLIQMITAFSQSSLNMLLSRDRQQTGLIPVIPVCPPAPGLVESNRVLASARPASLWFYFQLVKHQTAQENVSADDTQIYP